MVLGWATLTVMSVLVLIAGINRMFTDDGVADRATVTDSDQLAPAEVILIVVTVAFVMVAAAMMVRAALRYRRQARR